MEHDVEQYPAKDGNVTLHTWTVVEGLKKKNFYITGAPVTPIPYWFRKVFGQKSLADIADLPSIPSGLDE